jgi:LEA14-like dessication related protein
VNQTLVLIIVALASIVSGCGASPTVSARDESTVETATAMSGPPAPLEVTQPMTEILGTDGVNVAVRSRVLIRNPNPYPVTLNTLDGVLWLDGAQAATARIEGNDVLEGRSDRVFQLDANVPVQLVMNVRSRTYTTSGTIHATAPDGSGFDSPFSFEGPLPGY